MGSQSDAATQLTFPTSSFDDYAPTVSADGLTMTFLRCNSSGTNCQLYKQSPILGGTATAVTTSVAPANPDAVSGATLRPEIDPADSTKAIYVGTDGHIHLVSLTASFTERALSAESGVSTFNDEFPDWNPGGTQIVFDSNRTGGHKVFLLNPTATPATATALWGSGDPGTEIEPIYAPSSPKPTEYVWTKLGSGSNIVIDMGAKVGNAIQLDSLTNSKTNNSQPAWQPTPNPTTGAPEVPNALLLPAFGPALLAGAILIDQQRRRRTQRARA